MRAIAIVLLVCACGSGGGGSGGAAGSGGSGGSGGTSGSGGTGGSGGSGGTSGSGGSSGVGGSGGMPDAPNFGPPGQLTCGLNGTTMTCSPGQTCCANFFTSPAQITCRTGNCQNGESSFACDGPEDCNGQLCCMHFALQSMAYCAAQCASGDSEVCHYGGTCPPAASHCCTSMGAPSGVCVATPPSGATCN